MGKFSVKLLIFLSPFIAWLLIANFFLPIDFYYYRAWEAISPKKLSGVWPGFFYPSQYIDKIEKGDLGPHTEYAQTHRAVWQTDKYGMRNSGFRSDYDIAVLGDSTATGAALSQEETLASRLAAITGLTSYAYTSGSVEDFLADQRFGEHKPKIIIMSRMERMLPGLARPADLSLVGSHQFSSLEKLRLNPYFSKVAIFFDRALDPTAFKYLKFKLTGQKSHFYTYVSGKILFFGGPAANQTVSSDLIDQSVAALTSYSEQLRALGYRFIFVPAPNKENIYYQMMPDKLKPIFLQQLIAGLKHNGVEVIDTQSIFDSEFAKHGPVMYYDDDSHWNVLGVNLVVAEISKLLKK